MEKHKIEGFKDKIQSQLYYKAIYEDSKILYSGTIHSETLKYHGEGKLFH